MSITSLQGKHRLSQKQKDANDKRWYKEQADLLDTKSVFGRGSSTFNGPNRFQEMKVNYDLFNNKIDIAAFNHVCKPFGDEVGELPATFENRDIVSPKIKVLLGMEMKMPFAWKIVATNEEATTRKEEEEFGKIKDFVVGSIMKPIRTEAEKKAREQMKGKELSPEEQQEIQEQIEQEIEAKTPDKARRYMSREHQDPAEALSRQILEHEIIDRKIAFKFNKGFKHSCLAGTEIYWVGERNNRPDMQVVNPMYFDYDMSPETDFIEDGEWAVYEIRMSPSQVIANFGNELTPTQIDKIYEFHADPSKRADVEFTFDNTPNDGFTVRVIHCTWKSLKPVYFLTYYDKKRKVQETLVDENYKLAPQYGDIRLEKLWIPEVHECYKIMDDIYVYARPVPGQHKDIDNLWDCKLPYYGASCDNLNSAVTSPMDRMRSYQYFHNIILYRIELLMASDEGKLLAGNINAIPKSAGIDINKWEYFAKANKRAWFNPNEEGNRNWNGDIGNIAKVLDMSLISEIDRYMNIANEIDRKCGASVGVTPQMEAQIAASEAVTNTQQNLVQASYIIQPYFELHNVVKANVLQAYLDTAKETYARTKPKKLTYILDDMSQHMIDVDPELLENSRLGLFVANSSKASDAKRAVEQLSQAALQNQQADLSDIIKIIKADSINEAEEHLEAAEGRKNAQLQAMEVQKIKAQKQANIAQAEREELQHKRELEKIALKAAEDRETKLQVQAMLSVGFNEDKDTDGDGKLDVMEVYKEGNKADINNRKLQQDQQKLDLENRKFEHQQGVDKKKLENDEEKIQVARMKKKTSS